MKKLGWLCLGLVLFLAMSAQAAQMVNIDASNVSTGATPVSNYGRARDYAYGDVVAVSVKASCSVAWRLVTVAGSGLSQDASRVVVGWQTNSGATAFFDLPDAATRTMYGDRIVLETKLAETNVNTVTARILVDKIPMTALSASVEVASLTEGDPAWVAVSNTVMTGSALGATALQPDGNLVGYIGSTTTAVDTVVSGSALGATALQPLTEGTWAVVDSTQLVFVASGVTNVIDSDLTTP